MNTGQVISLIVAIIVSAAIVTFSISSNLPKESSVIDIKTLPKSSKLKDIINNIVNQNINNA